MYEFFRCHDVDFPTTKVYVTLALSALINLLLPLLQTRPESQCAYLKAGEAPL